MGIRRAGREHALQILYGMGLNPASPEEAIRLFWESHKAPASVRSFADSLITGVLGNMERIDAEIAAKSPNWSISRMSRIDLAVLRIAVFELLFREDIPKNVTINEAIEIGKVFGSEDTSAFVNGILDEIARTLPGK
ncbi:MAG: transcription antitermination factor NusB [Desulfuromonadales bacterium]|nr:transcription antitermination factor NusB [Desulfuromonadales bacterium]